MGEEGDSRPSSFIFHRSSFNPFLILADLVHHVVALPSQVIPSEETRTKRAELGSFYGRQWPFRVFNYYTAPFEIGRINEEPG
jgi:hypothetical protein